MKTYSAVIESINGTISTPRLFRDAYQAEKHFNKVVKENNAEVIHTDEFCQIGECEGGYSVAFYTQIEIE